MYESFVWILSGDWGTPVALRISQALSATAISLILAILALRVAAAGKDAFFSATASLPNFFAEFGGLFLRAIVLMYIVSNWPTFMGYVKSTQTDISATVVGSSATPELVARRAMATMDYYQGLISTGSVAWAMNPSNQASGPAPAPAEETGTLQSLIDSFLQVTKALVQLPTLLANFVVSILSSIAVWVLCGVIVAALIMPMLMLFIALSIGPLVLAAMMSKDRLSEELSSGWLEILLTTVLAVPVLFIIVALIEPALTLPATSTNLDEGATGRLVQVARDLSTLLFFGTFLAMPLAIANGIINGRVPNVNPVHLMLALVWRFITGTVSALSKLGRRKIRK